MKIKSQDISVVVQGNVDKVTANTLKSVRRFLPKAEIILSTWKAAAYEGLDYDKLVLNKDPGAVTFDKRLNKLNNINRIIVSSKAGVRHAKRKYILLLRSDLVLINDNVLRFADHLKRKESVSLFKHRIFAYEMFSLKFEERDNKRYYSIFHVSDWCRFGLAEDIKELFNIPTVKEPDFSQFYIKNPSNRILDIWPGRMWKMSPEQYITSENAKKVYPHLEVANRLDWRPEVLQSSDEFIVNNFAIKSIKEWGIVTYKDSYKERNIKSSPLTARGAWLGRNFAFDYKKYCDPNYILSPKYTWQEDFHVVRYISKLHKHWGKFVLPFKLLGYFISETASVVFYALCVFIGLLIGTPVAIYKILIRAIFYDTKHSI